MRVNDEGRKLGDALQGGGVTTSQVRNILDSFQRINELWEKDGPDERGRKLAKLGPNLTYLAARDTNSHRKAVLLGLAETLGSGVDEVLQATDESGERRRRFRALIDLVEAITAYHRLKARS
jgi:CRISPR type III-A-associated protein Csm2